MKKTLPSIQTHFDSIYKFSSEKLCKHFSRYDDLLKKHEETTCVRRRGGTRYPGSNAKFDTGLQEAETIERPLPETGNGSLKMYSSE